MYVVEPSGQFKIGDSNFCLDAQTGQYILLHASC